MKDDKVRQDKIRARRGTRVATTTEVIGEGEGGRGGRVVKRVIVVNRTSEGERTLNTRRVGSTATPAAANMVVIVVSRLSWTLRKERKKKREKRKGKDRTAGECSRQKRVRILARVECTSYLRRPPSPAVIVRRIASRKTCGSAWGIKSINPRPQIHSNLPSMTPRGSLEACK